MQGPRNRLGSGWQSLEPRADLGETGSYEDFHGPRFDACVPNCFDGLYFWLLAGRRLGRVSPLPCPANSFGGGSGSACQASQVIIDFCVMCVSVPPRIRQTALPFCSCCHASAMRCDAPARRRHNQVACCNQQRDLLLVRAVPVGAGCHLRLPPQTAPHMSTNLASLSSSASKLPLSSLGILDIHMHNPGASLPSPSPSPLLLVDCVRHVHQHQWYPYGGRPMETTNRTNACCVHIDILYCQQIPYEYRACMPCACCRAVRLCDGRCLSPQPSAP